MTKVSFKVNKNVLEGRISKHEIRIIQNQLPIDNKDPKETSLLRKLKRRKTGNH